MARQARALKFGLAIGSTIAVDVLAQELLEGPPRGSDWLLGGLLFIVAAQFGLCCVWVGLSRASWFLRYGGLLLSALFIRWFLWRWEPPFARVYIAMHFSEAVTLLAVLSAIRFLGFRLGDTSESKGNVPDVRARQFSIIDLLKLTTLIAACTGAVIDFGPRVAATLRGDMLVLWLLIGWGASLAMTLILSVAATLGRRFSPIVTVLTLLAAAGVGWASDRLANRVGLFLFLMLAAVAFEFAVLLTLRRLGYRVRRLHQDTENLGASDRAVLNRALAAEPNSLA